MDDYEDVELDSNVPDLLEDKVEVSPAYINYDRHENPTSFGVDMEFDEMGFYKEIKSRDPHLLINKVEQTLEIWEDKYRRHLDKTHKANRAERVEELNENAKQSFETLQTILAHTLGIDDTIDWNAMKRKEKFRVKPAKLFPSGKVPEFITFAANGLPKSIKPVESPPEPSLDAIKTKYNWVLQFVFGKKIETEHQDQLQAWRIEEKQARDKNLERNFVFKHAKVEFEEQQRKFAAELEHDNAAIDHIRDRYRSADRDAIEEYCDLVLTNSQYPDYFPQNWTFEYRSDSRIALVDYELPAPGALPTIESYKYVKSRDEVTEKHISAAAQKKLYDSVIYQVCIRTIHELFEADAIQSIDSVGFNGIVTAVNPATGVAETKTIVSVMASKDEFMQFDLARVDPKATFKHLKGVAATALIDLAPIPPVIQLEKTDKRFIDGRNVAHNLDDSVNIAAMHWDDFEHLVRELFEKEFGGNGGEVKVTQASADGGVDAVAFDSDPVRGGKIVIQAKRYTNTVGVSAVRDLYGTVMNEGAMKGVLVTTSDYGKDSYEFAKDKPITLLNGNNLLAMLEKHGHKARINVAEAKKQRAVR